VQIAAAHANRLHLNEHFIVTDASTGNLPQFHTMWLGRKVNNSDVLHGNCRHDGIVLLIVPDSGTRHTDTATDPSAHSKRGFPFAEPSVFEPPEPENSSRLLNLSTRPISAIFVGQLRNDCLTGKKLVNRNVRY
jgi:hypothetical protein